MRTRPLFLLGMMGAGKSSVGRELARRSGAAFIDLDERIERLFASSVSQLFELGEDYFRACEHTALISLVREPGFASAGAIVATGGGVVTRPDNLRLMAAVGDLVYLEVDVETLAARLSTPAQRELRPLLHVVDEALGVRDSNAGPPDGECDGGSMCDGSSGGGPRAMGVQAASLRATGVQAEGPRAMGVQAASPRATGVQAGDPGRWEFRRRRPGRREFRRGTPGDGGSLWGLGDEGSRGSPGSGGSGGASSGLAERLRDLLDARARAYLEAGHVVDARGDVAEVATAIIQVTT